MAISKSYPLKMPPKMREQYLRFQEAMNKREPKKYKTKGRLKKVQKEEEKEAMRAYERVVKDMQRYEEEKAAAKAGEAQPSDRLQPSGMEGG